MKKIFKGLISIALVFSFVLVAASGIFPKDAFASGANVYCNVTFTKPAICCNEGDVVDLSKCGVQFTETSTMTTDGITWTYNGSTINKFVPDKRGVYELIAKSGSNSKKVYVVAKSAEETEYVLYRNDFDVAPSDYRVVENTNGSNSNISVVDGNYIMDATASDSSYVRILLPSFLDAFGDVKFTARIKMAAAVNDSKWASLMYRVQNGNYPYYQGCLRYEATASNGVEISKRNSSNLWDVFRVDTFNKANKGDYNLCSITANGTNTKYSINGYDVLNFANTEYAVGAMGIQTRGTKLMIDFVEVSLAGNDPIATSNDVSFAKPAIRADLGDTIDLSQCDVQFTADAVYTKGSNITWKKDGAVISTFTPDKTGVTALTATSGSLTKNVYVVTRALADGEYVLYMNNFDSAPTDFRVIQQTGATFSHDGSGKYIIDASSSDVAFGRVLLPSFLDDFGDFKFETSYKDVTASSERNWSSIMAHIQNNNYPYIQFCIRNNPAVSSGVEMTERTESDTWNVRSNATYSSKTSGGYNTYTLIAQNNNINGYINGAKLVSVNTHKYVSGAMGFQAKGVKLTVDYVKVTLGETSAKEDTSVKCYVAKSRPAIGCNVGQTILLNECFVQFTYGSYAVKGSEIIWKKDGKVITEFSDTTVGMHTLTATHGHTTMNVYIVVKKTTDAEYVIYSNDFTSGPTDYRVPEKTNGGSVYPINGTFVLNGSASADAYVRVLLPFFVDEFGDATMEASIKLTAPTDASKWASIIYRSQNGENPYMQCCYRYNTAVSNGVEISQRTADNTWNVLQKASTSAHNAGVYNTIKVDISNLITTFYINGTKVLETTNTPFSEGAWGFQVRGLTMTIDHLKMSFASNYTSTSLYTIPGGYVDVRDPSTGLSVAPTIVTDVKTKADFDNILTDCPAVAIMNYEIVDGVAKVVFKDGAVSPEKAVDKLGAKIIPAFRVNDEKAVDSLAAFLMGRSIKDAYAVSSNLALLKRGYSKWIFLRGVADFSTYTGTDAEGIRYQATENTARVLILPESTSKEMITKLQDSYACVWLTISEGKTASVAATNKGPYGLITPDRAVTEYCFKTYYGANTVIRRPNIIGHRGNPSQAPENTIYGTNVAYKNGATMVENDLYLTIDNVVYIMHDKDISRTTNGTGNILEMTSAQVSKYKVDYFSGVSPQTIPTLEDYFKTIKGNPRQKLVLEMKHPETGSLAKALAALIKKYDIMDQIVVISFIPSNLIYIRQEIPGIAVGWLNWLEFDETNPVYSTYVALEEVQKLNSVCNPGFAAATPRWSAPVIRDLAYRGVTLWPWTINTQAQFDQLWLGGIGGITTDYSQYVSKYIESIHWNSASRVISATYQNVLTDITNSCEVVVIEDTLGITCSAGNITVPQNKNGKASFYYRYKSTTSTGQSYYTVTEIRTIQVGSVDTFELKADSVLSLKDSMLINVTDKYTASMIKSQFKYSVVVTDKNGNALADSDKVGTGCAVYLASDKSKSAVILIEGDVNGDGTIDGTDYLKIKTHFLGAGDITGVYFEAADCDNDGVVGSTDYLRLKSYFIGTYDLFG